MEKVYICGHKNPDTDSISSSVAYAYLKSQIDPKYEYLPIRAGSASEQTKFIFDSAKTQLPIFIKDIYTKVSDSMTKNLITVNENDPVSLILKYINQHEIRFTPVLDNSGMYKGMAGVMELTSLFLRDDRATKPTFLLRPDTLKRSLKAKVLNEGNKQEFDASIIVATMPYESFNSHVAEKCVPSKTILVVGNRKNILDDAFKGDYPAVIIVGLKDEEIKDIDFKGFKGWVFASPFDSAQTIRCIEMATPIKKVINNTIPTASLDDYLDSVVDQLSQTSIKALPVVQDGKLMGIITSSDMLKRKKSKLILVDHNEVSQGIDGAEVAEILEIVDHHRLGTIKTSNPIYFYAKPVGSTCTLVYQLFKANGIAIPDNIALLLLGGILSDTVIMKSPTTTQDDHVAVAELQDISGIDAKEYGIKIFSATDSLTSRDMKDVVGADFKIYDENNIKIGVSQVETVTLQEIDTVLKDIRSELLNQKQKHNLHWAMILITDIIKEDSLLVTTGFASAEKLMTYKLVGENLFHLPGVLSRKKQLLPEVLRILEELNRS